MVNGTVGWVGGGCSNGWLHGGQAACFLQQADLLRAGFHAALRPLHPCPVMQSTSVPHRMQFAKKISCLMGPFSKNGTGQES